MVLVDGPLSSGEREETEKEHGNEVHNSGKDTQGSQADDQPEDVQPDLDDVASEVGALHPSQDAKFNAWVSVGQDATFSQKVHKASILCRYSSPLTIVESKDHLRRVQGYSHYNETEVFTLPHMFHMDSVQTAWIPCRLHTDFAQTCRYCKWQVTLPENHTKSAWSPHGVCIESVQSIVICHSSSTITDIHVYNQNF